MELKVYCPFCKEIIKNDDLEKIERRDGVIRIIEFVHIDCRTKTYPIIDLYPLGYNPYQE